VPTSTPTSTAASATGSTELVVNGGFEAGQTPWHEQSSGGYQMIDYSNPHTGSYSAWLCGLQHVYRTSLAGDQRTEIRHQPVLRLLAVCTDK
jgi:hypothetical protein